jgi:transcriptional regulator with XRE-family HTH domain
MRRKRAYGTKELEKEIGGLTFAKLLEAHRKTEELSQKELAEMLNISPSSLCDLEKGRKIPSPTRAMQIAQALGVSEGLWVEVAIQNQLNE